MPDAYGQIRNAFNLRACGSPGALCQRFCCQCFSQPVTGAAFDKLPSTTGSVPVPGIDAPLPQLSGGNGAGELRALVDTALPEPDTPATFGLAANVDRWQRTVRSKPTAQPSCARFKTLRRIACEAAKHARRARGWRFQGQRGEDLCGRQGVIQRVNVSQGAVLQQFCHRERHHYTKIRADTMVTLHAPIRSGRGSIARASVVWHGFGELQIPPE